MTKGKECTVKLKTLTFSDGSNITADDVVYSYNLARKSNSSYAYKLYEVQKVSAADSQTVVFKLNKADPYFINVLDFPILKKGSDSITDSDSVLQPPIGSGRYKVNDERKGFVINQNYYGKKGSIKEIRLINAPDMESVSHYVEIGAADIYYSDISDGRILRMSGKKTDINLNNLIYIGVNHNYGDLGKVELRQAISSALDRQKICTNAFYNNALAATGFFNPVWSETKSVQNIQIEAKTEISIENLKKIGYNSLDKGGKSPKFTLLVNSENRIKAAAAAMIAEQLSLCGIKVTVVEKRYAQYIECLKKGDFQLYLGEIKLTENMDITQMVSQKGTAAFGIKKQVSDKTDKDKSNTETEKQNTQTAATVEEVLNSFYSGANTIADIASVLQSEMPFIPVCYRTGILFSNDNIENVNNSSASDVYFSIESYLCKN